MVAKNKKKFEKKQKETEAQKRFKARVLSDSFDFSPANKKERCILPTPLEDQAASRSEELIKEDGRFSPNLNFRCDLVGETSARKQLRQTNTAGASAR